MFGNIFDDFFGTRRASYQPRQRPYTAYNYMPTQGQRVYGYDDDDEDTGSESYGNQYQPYTYENPYRQTVGQQQRSYQQQRQNQNNMYQQQNQGIQQPKQQYKKQQMTTQKQPSQKKQQQQQQMQQEPVNQQMFQQQAKQQIPTKQAFSQPKQQMYEQVSHNISQDVAARQENFFKQQEANERAKTQMFVDGALGGGQSFKTATNPAKISEEARVRPMDELSSKFLYQVSSGYDIRIPEHMVTGIQISANRRGVLTLSAEISHDYLQQIQAFQQHLTLKFQLPNYYDRSDILAHKENGVYIVHVPINDNAVDDEMIIGIV